MSPQPNTVLGAQNPYTFSFEVTQWDGGMWPGDVPLWVDEGMLGPNPSRLTRKDVTFEADVTLANRAGAQSVVAGWLEVDAGITVMAKKCDVNCQPWEECVPNASGGQCVDTQLTLTFTAPAEGQEYGPINSGQVPLKLTVKRADGGVFSRPVPFALSKDGAIRLTGALDKFDSVWQATADAGAEDGPRGLFAGWDGGPHALGTFKVTATPPTITLKPDTAPTRPNNQTDVDGKPRWKKSEVATVRLESNRDLLVAPTSADFDNVSAVTGATTCTEACVAPRCYCFAVDLAQLPFAQADAGTLYGTVPVSLKSSLVDVLGNSGTAAPATFDATRFKWSLDVSYGAAKTPTATALTIDGRVLVGVSAALSPPVAPSALTALNPDGGISWRKTYTTEAVTAGPIAGTTGVYFAVYTGTQGQLRRLDFDGNSATNKCIIDGLTYPGDMALASPGISEFPLAIARYTSSTSATLMSGAPNTCGESASFGSLSASARPTLIVDSTQAYLAVSTQAPVWKFGSLNTTPMPQGSRTTATLFPSNLFLAGTSVVGGGGGPTVGGVFALYDVGGVLDGGLTVNATPGTSPGGAAVVGAPGVGDTRPWVFYGDSAGNVRKARIVLDNPPAFDSLPDPLVIGGADFSSTAPLLGANDRMYSASANVLYVLGAAGPSEEWHWTAPDAISAQLNLDKNRDSTHPCAVGQPGVLYVVTAGTQTTVYAILVDSPGLDPAAPWPRYQHDPGNTGNSGTSLAAWACP